ncbi:MAG: hypothetical protein GX494_02710 [Clostridiaceae bacterium]|nr:hypothetical protein [Clostridiaceae bacterium]
MMKNISEERMQILKMIEEGKLSAAEAMDLMNALEKDAADEELAPKKPAKWLKIRVKTMEDKTKVKLNIPISPVDVGLRLRAAYVTELKEAGLDQIDMKEVIEAVKNGAEGKIVDIEDEESQTKIEVYVE